MKLIQPPVIPTEKKYINICNSIHRSISKLSITQKGAYQLAYFHFAHSNERRVVSAVN